MPKTVTLRLKEESYELFSKMAKAENRSLSNLIETYAIECIRESQFADDVEMAEILSNKILLRRIEKGSSDAIEQIGRFVS